MKKIIHLDNSEFFRKLVKTFLEGEGFEVESFKDTQDASLSIASGTANMVIMGLTFVDIKGEDFLVRIKESFEGPVVVISSSVDKSKEAALVAKGAKAAINKSGPWKDELKLHLSALV